MNKFLIALFALVLSFDSFAQIFSVQGETNPQTGAVATVAADLKDAVLQISTDSVTFTQVASSHKPVYVIYGCVTATTGGLREMYLNGVKMSEGVWVYNGATIFDALATKMCYTAYNKANAAPVKTFRKYLDGSK